MSIMYKSTRSNAEKVTASQAILKGLADDGGLFVPDSIPALDVPLGALAGMTYQETAYEVMKLFLGDFTEDELKACIRGAYDSKFDTETIAPVVKKDGAYYLELFHGKTIAFKDMALSILPYLMTTSAKKNGVKNEIVILTATSGDTGKAALAGFADVEGTSIIVFYPKNGVSPIQEKQMLTQKGKNTNVVGIIGNFDDAQTGVKQMFNSKELAERMDKKGYQFSSANSINIGRLVPQIVYYVYAYGQLLKQGEISEGEKINVVVPTGNFGNILAAYYAKNMGLPIDTLFCASNDNKVLYDFFETGKYDRKREFILTASPSMDILISSNLERQLFELSGRDTQTIAQWMADLKETGRFTVDAETLKCVQDTFKAGSTSDDECLATIKQVFDQHHYLLDPHTAVAYHVADKQRGENPLLIASTAHWAKFGENVYRGLHGIGAKEPLPANISALSGCELNQHIAQEIGNPYIPKGLAELDNLPIRFTKTIEPAIDSLEESVLNFVRTI